MAKPRFVMIGGFLGAGKTTAIVKLAEHLRATGRRAGVITNDQSVNLVDTARVRAAGIAVEEITGGCFCCKFDSVVGASQRLCADAATDVLVAEPVGSCTDLVATVSYPLRKWWRDDFEVAPYSVLVDPHRAGEILRPGGGAFSDKVLYVYRKQLEEADLLVINKVDLLDAAARSALRAALAKRFPQARLLEVSCLTGEGLLPWFEAMLGGLPGARPAMEVDYDVYAEGEARLGWLNASVDVAWDREADGDAFLLALAEAMAAALRESGEEIAHLKMTLAPETDRDARAGMGAVPALAAVSLTRTMAAPLATRRLDAALRRGTLTINLRAEADPDRLRGRVLEAIARVAPRGAQVRELAAFRPGRPTPTHRMTFAESPAGS
ncbi:MAG: cobalamin biosynthesis protein P47K [Planctomycetota bacterium]|nr:cobalamin biosynthesis protein P47K [Planctomycetota bacterium]